MDLEGDWRKAKGGAFALKYVLTVTASAIAELGTSDHRCALPPYSRAMARAEISTFIEFVTSGFDL